MVMEPNDRRQATGGAVAERMRELGLTPAELADKARVDVRTIRRMIAGEVWPRYTTRDRVLAALGWTIGDLVRRVWGVEVDIGQVPTDQLVQELCKRIGGHSVSD